VQQNVRPVTTASIAVLPFVDLSPSQDQEFFSDGLSEEILNHLAKIPNLKVVARTSAFQFKGKSEDLRVIREKLNVENVLEGSVRREGTRIRITAQLIKTNDGFHLWSESYDRDFRNVLTVQDDIAKAVTSALQIKLLGGRTPAVLQSSRTTSPEAYQDFLQSRYFAARGDIESQQKAQDYVNQAIQADPRFAEAYALRARLTLNSGAIGWTDYPAAISNSRRDTQKAVELDANLADGYRGLSRIQAIADSNCRAAETTLKRAMELAPGSADNMETAAFIANCLGREEEAIGFVQQALALDPIVAGPYRLLAQYLRNLGRYDEAHGALAKALDLNPQELWIHETQGEVYLAQGRPPEALAEMEQEAPGCLHDFGMAIAFHALGRHEQSESALASLISRYSSGSAYQIAQVYAYRGEVDKAFEWLTRAYQQHDGGLCLTKTDLLLKSLRGDSRYEQLLRTLNLAD
jgi:TolB-like protein/Tfp pilus assembly protein PilF